MTHEMKLQEVPFKMIKKGIKTIEMRLYDEKRKKISVGDSIHFTNVVTGEVLQARVINLHTFKTFDDLYETFEKSKLGYEEDEIANPEDMKQYYSDDEIEKYGVVGIEIAVNQ